MRFRTVLFWLHLVAGVLAGAVIGVMSFTGVALAFEKEILAKAESDLRHIAPPTGDAKPLTLDDLLSKVREVQPGVRYASLSVFADTGLAMVLSAGRTNTAYLNPYTGEVKPAGSPHVRRFLQAMNDWHRWLGRDGDGRAVGKAITGAGNAAFLVLAVSGLYLWWPRQWTRTALRAVALPTVRLRGKARDWNWHNAIGLWSAPVLIVLTAAALPMSYRWAGDAVYKLTGSPVPATTGPGGGGGFGPAVEVPTPAPGAKRLGYAALLAEAEKQSPAWEQITIRLGGGPRGGGGGEGRGGEGRNRRTEGVEAPKPAGEGARPADPAPKERAGGEERRSPQAVSISIRERGGWPRFATTQLALDPFTGGVLRAEGFADYNGGRKARSWMRFLHTGEALGPIGQAVAGLASLGGVVLVWTGFALAVRRLMAAWSRRASLPPG